MLGGAGSARLNLGVDSCLLQVLGKLQQLGENSAAKLIYRKLILKKTHHLGSRSSVTILFLQIVFNCLKAEPGKFKIKRLQSKAHPEILKNTGPRAEVYDLKFNYYLYIPLAP